MLSLTNLGFEQFVLLIFLSLTLTGTFANIPLSLLQKAASSPKSVFTDCI